MSTPWRLPDRPSRAPPEAPPAPEASQPKEDLPATEKPEPTENTVQADDSPEASDTAAPPPDPAEAQETAEPRSRQEHADQPPHRRRPRPADAGAEDRKRSQQTESASDLPHSTDVTREGDDDEIGMASENPMPDSVPSQEDSTGHEATEDADRSSPSRQDAAEPRCSRLRACRRRSNPPTDRQGMGRTRHRSPRHPRQGPRTKDSPLTACTQLILKGETGRVNATVLHRFAHR